MPLLQVPDQCVPDLDARIINDWLTSYQMRAGTQTLIQALQALPWMNADNDEDGPTYPGSPGSADSESDDEERPPCKLCGIFL